MYIYIYFSTCTHTKIKPVHKTSETILMSETMSFFILSPGCQTLFVAALSAAKATVNRVGGSQVGDFGHSAIPD